MEATEGKPVRKRRRRLIVALVLLLGLGWWFWPRGDERFVGKWWLDNDTWGIRMELELRSNGRGTRRGVSPNVVSFSWFVADNEFVVGDESFGSLPAPVGRLIDWLRSMLRVTAVKYERFEVVEVSPTRIRMVSKRNRCWYTLMPHDR